MAQWHDAADLRVFEKKVIRKIFGPVRVDDDFRIRFNSELYELLKDIDLVQPINIQRLRWRMEDCLVCGALWWFKVVTQSSDRGWLSANAAISLRTAFFILNNCTMYRPILFTLSLFNCCRCKDFNYTHSVPLRWQRNSVKFFLSLKLMVNRSRT